MTFPGFVDTIGKKEAFKSYPKSNEEVLNCMKKTHGVPGLFDTVHKKVIV